MKRIFTTLKLKWPEYLLEILVITMSILGAYTLNNWNDDRKNKNRETLYLKSINEEFKDNREQFEQITEWHTLARNALRGILAEYKSKTPNADSLMKHHWRAWIPFTFNPSQSSIESLLSTSSLDVIQNDELRKLLVSWHDLALDYQDEEIAAEAYYYDHIRPYLERNFKHASTLQNGELVYGRKLDQTLENMIHFRIIELTYILENLLENPYPENEKVREAMNRIIQLSAAVK